VDRRRSSSPRARSCAHRNYPRTCIGGRAARPPIIPLTWPRSREAIIDQDSPTFPSLSVRVFSGQVSRYTRYEFPCRAVGAMSTHCGSYLIPLSSISLPLTPSLSPRDRGPTSDPRTTFELTSMDLPPALQRNSCSSLTTTSSATQISRDLRSSS